MIVLRFSVFVLLLVLLPFWAAAQTKQPPAVYYPDAEWQRKAPADAGIHTAISHRNPTPQSLSDKDCP